jgi:hypothetical protein
VIANTVLGMLAGDEGGLTRNAEAAPNLDGPYRSTYWDIGADLTVKEGAPVITVTEGLVVTDGGEGSNLWETADGGFRGDGGMFHGFDVSLRESDDGTVMSGGLYPFTFKRSETIDTTPELVPDVRADLTGTWRGMVTTPLGPVSLELTVQDSQAAAASLPFAQGVALEGCSAKEGRVSGRFAVTAPVAGEMVLHPRLVAANGKLKGPVYAWGFFGELAFPTELERV